MLRNCSSSLLATATPHLTKSLPVSQRLTPDARRTTEPPSGSGTGPEQASEAIHPTPRARRESPILARASLRAQARPREALTHDMPQTSAG
jgi:hypothetical protein